LFGFYTYILDFALVYGLFFALNYVAPFDLLMYINSVQLKTIINLGRRGRDRIVVGFTTIYATRTYHH
jgi:hypothetical protein